SDVLRLSAVDPHGEWKGQSPLRRRDGSALWTDVMVSKIEDPDGSPTGYIAIHRDITDRKAVEQRLRFQALLLDSVRESIVAISPAGKVTFWGKGAERLFGYTREEALNQNLELLTYPAGNTGPSLSEIHDEVLRNSAWHSQLLRRRKDGSEFYADIAVAPVRDSDGNAVGLIGIHRDVT